MCQPTKPQTNVFGTHYLHHCPANNQVDTDFARGAEVCDQPKPPFLAMSLFIIGLPHSLFTRIYPYWEHRPQPHRRYTPRKATCHNMRQDIPERYREPLDVWFLNRAQPTGMRMRVLEYLEMTMGRPYRVAILCVAGFLFTLNHLGYLGTPELGVLSPYQYGVASRIAVVPEILNSTLGVSHLDWNHIRCCNTSSC